MLRIISLSLVLFGVFGAWLGMLMDTAAIATATTSSIATHPSFAGISWIGIAVMIVGMLLGRLSGLVAHRGNVSAIVVSEELFNQVADFCDVEVRDLEESPVRSLDAEGIEQIASLQMNIREVIARLPKPADLAGAEAFRAYNKAQREMASPIATIARIARREAFDAHIQYRRALRGTVGFPMLQCTPSCRDMAQVISLRHNGLTH